MEVEISDEWVTFTDTDATYVQCRKCRRYGAKAWLHACAESNWYSSLEGAKTAYARQKKNSFRMRYLSSPTSR